MSGTKRETGFTFTIDGVEITAYAGQTIMEAADEAGVYIRAWAITRACATRAVAGSAR